MTGINPQIRSTLQILSSIRINKTIPRHITVKLFTVKRQRKTYKQPQGRKRHITFTDATVRGTCLAQSGKPPTADFSSGHGLTIVDSSAASGSMLSVESA